MAHKYSISADYDASLKEIAERLPVPEQAGRTPMLGAQLTKEQPGLRDTKGQPLDPDKQYYVGSPVEAVNHLRRLRRAYETGGQHAVVGYLLPYQAFLVSPAEAESILLAQD